MGGHPLNDRVVGIAAVSQVGYDEVAADGGIFAFGPGGAFYGSLAGQQLHAPVVGIATAPGGGYQLVGGDGGAFAFGEAGFYGSIGGGATDDVVALVEPSRNSIPVSKIIQTDGTPRAVVQVSVGGGPAVPVVLDTGSTGLHILASVVGPAGVTTVEPATATETYAAEQYMGPIDAAPVTIGGVASVGPVAFMSIQSVGCVSGSNCLSPTIPDLIANGIYGTMGVSLSTFPLGNLQQSEYSPLLQLPGGESGFTIGFSTAQSGSATLGAPTTTATSDAFALSAESPAANANGSGAWKVDSAQVCWTVDHRGPVCSPGSTFDTGTPQPQVNVGDFSGTIPTSGGYLDNGISVALSAAPGEAPFWSYVAGSVPYVNQTGDTGLNGSAILGTAGLTIYFSSSVTYDAATGQVIVTPNPST
jgi:hypothetical protein